MVQKYENQLAIQKQIAEVTARIADNKKKGFGNEEEIQALRDIGKTLDENRSNGYDKISKRSGIEFAVSIRKLATDAAAADAAMYEQKAQAALEPLAMPNAAISCRYSSTSTKTRSSAT